MSDLRFIPPAVPLRETAPTHHCTDILAEGQISLGLRVRAGTLMTVASRLKVSKRRGQQYGGEQKASDLGQQPS